MISNYPSTTTSGITVTLSQAQTVISYCYDDDLRKSLPGPLIRCNRQNCGRHRHRCRHHCACLCIEHYSFPSCWVGHYCYIQYRVFDSCRRRLLSALLTGRHVGTGIRWKYWRAERSMKIECRSKCLSNESQSHLSRFHHLLKKKKNSKKGIILQRISI